MPLPILPRRNLRTKTGGSFSAPAPPHSHPNVGAGVNRRAGVQTQPSLITRSLRTIDSEQKALSTQVLPGKTYTLPENSDFNRLVLNPVITLTTASSGGNFDQLAVIDHIEINSSKGRPYARIPGGTFLYDYFVRYARGAGYPQPTSAPANTIVGTSTTTAAMTIELPINIAAGSQLVFYYQTLAGLLSTTAPTALTVTLNFHVAPCDPIANVTRINGPQAGGLLSTTGSVYLQNQAIPQSAAVSELFIRGLGALTNVNTITIVTAGQVVENVTPEALFAQRMINNYYNAFVSASTLILDEPTTFGLDRSSEFIINMNTAAGSATLNWVWYEPAALYR
jgi:hypothetical protein